MIESGEKGYKLPEQILFNFVPLYSPLFCDLLFCVYFYPLTKDYFREKSRSQNMYPTSPNTKSTSASFNSSVFDTIMLMYRHRTIIVYSESCKIQ